MRVLAELGLARPARTADILSALPMKCESKD